MIYSVKEVEVHNIPLKYVELANKLIVIDRASFNLLLRGNKDTYKPIHCKRCGCLIFEGENCCPDCLYPVK